MCRYGFAKCKALHLQFVERMLKKSVFMTKRVPRGKTCFLLGKTTHYQLCVILVLVNEGDVLLFFAIPTIFIAFPSNFAFCVAISHKMLWQMFVLVVCSYKKLFTFLLRTLFSVTPCIITIWRDFVLASKFCLNPFWYE